MRSLVPLLSRSLVFPIMDARDPYRRHSMTRALERDQWLPANVLQSRSADRLRSILQYAGQHCPYYQRLFADASFDPNRADLPRDLAKLPVLTKDLVRAQGDLLRSTAMPTAETLEARTGGSTGTALKVYFDPACQAARNAAAMRTDGWAGWKPGLAIGALWGNPPTMTSWREQLRTMLYERLIFLDTMDMTPARMTDFIVRCEREPGYLLYGHAHSLYLLARFLRDGGQTPRPPAGIVSTSMMLLDNERVEIEAVFGVRVSNRYGCEEVGLIAAECEIHRGLHINLDHVHLEVVDDEYQPVPPQVEGHLVVTDLINRAQPLIRYAVGDRGILDSLPCSCGRGLPLLAQLTGRVADFLVRRDGSKVAGISLIERTLTAIPGLKQLQIVQHTFDRFVLHMVGDEALTAASEAALRQEIRTVFGADVNVDLVHQDRIEPLPSGKYRFSICHVGREPVAHEPR